MRKIGGETRPTQQHPPTHHKDTGRREGQKSMNYIKTRLTWDPLEMFFKELAFAR